MKNGKHWLRLRYMFLHAFFFSFYLVQRVKMTRGIGRAVGSFQHFMYTHRHGAMARKIIVAGVTVFLFCKLKNATVSWMKSVSGWPVVTKITVKALNFEPLVKFGLFSRKVCCNVNAPYRKNEENESCSLVGKLKIICKFGLFIFRYFMHSKIRNLQEKVQSSHEGQN